MRMAVLMNALVLATGVAAAAPPLEPVEARLQVVNPAARLVRADGVVWALSSTAAVKMPGKKRSGLRDLKAGMHVRLGLTPVDGGAPVVSSITVLPD